MADLSGKKFDGEKIDMDLLSPYALEKIAQVMTYGKQKYGRDNWRGGIVYSRLLAAVMRHINAYRKGETFDPETGLSHLSHASCGLMMLLEFEETRPDLDDRFVKELKSDKSVDLYSAAEEAQKQVKEMVKYNKEHFFDKATKKITFPRGEIIKHINNDIEVVVVATYFDENDKEVLFVQDADSTDSKIVGVDPTFYKSIYKQKEQ